MFRDNPIVLVIIKLMIHKLWRNEFRKSRHRKHGIILEKNFLTWVKLSIDARRHGMIGYEPQTYKYVIAGILRYLFIIQRADKKFRVLHTLKIDSTDCL